MNISLFLFVVLNNITILGFKNKKNLLICDLTNSWSRKQSHHILAVRSLSGAFDHKTFILFWTLWRTFHPTDMFLLEPVRITVVNNQGDLYREVLGVKTIRSLLQYCTFWHHFEVLNLSISILCVFMFPLCLCITLVTSYTVKSETLWWDYFPQNLLMSSNFWAVFGSKIIFP